MAKRILKTVEVNGKQYVQGAKSYRELYNKGNGLKKSAIAKLFSVTPQTIHQQVTPEDCVRRAMKVMARSKKKKHTYGSIAKHFNLNNAVAASYLKKCGIVPLGIKLQQEMKAKSKVVANIIKKHKEKVGG